MNTNRNNGNHFRAIISPTYSDNKIPTQNKILAADGVMGIIILLSYWGGGTNLFPEGVLPEFFIARRDKEGRVQLSVDELTDLIRSHSQAINREIGALSASSLPVYLSQMKQGRRANGGGSLPPVETNYYKREQQLTVHPRDYGKDLTAGLVALIPHGMV